MQRTFTWGVIIKYLTKVIVVTIFLQFKFTLLISISSKNNYDLMEELCNIFQ